MYIRCAWCQLDMGRKAPFDEHTITHSICDKCNLQLLNEMHGVLTKNPDRPESVVFEEFTSIGSKVQ